MMNFTEAITVLIEEKAITERLPIDLSLFKDRPFFNNLKDENDLTGIEIGVEYGLNARRMLTQLDIKKLYLIDPYDNIMMKDIAKALLSEFNDKIIWIYKKSVDAIQDIKEEVDFVYIDGDHSYKSVLSDIELYLPLAKKFIAGHDFKNSEMGVIKAVSENFKYFDVDFWDWWIKR